MSKSNLYLGLDVHKDSITVAVFGRTGNDPLALERPRLRKSELPSRFRVKFRVALELQSGD